MTDKAQNRKSRAIWGLVLIAGLTMVPRPGYAQAKVKLLGEAGLVDFRNYIPSARLAGHAREGVVEPRTLRRSASAVSGNGNAEGEFYLGVRYQRVWA